MKFNSGNTTLLGSKPLDRPNCQTVCSSKFNLLFLYLRVYKIKELSKLEVLAAYNNSVLVDE